MQTTQQQTRLHPAVKKLVGKQGTKNAIYLDVPVPDANQVRPQNLQSTSSNTKSTEQCTSKSQTSKTITKDVPLPLKQPRYVAPKEKESSMVVSLPRAAHKVKKRYVELC